MNQTMHKDGDVNTLAGRRPAAFSTEELARRQRAGRRLAWILGAVAVALYVVGFLLKR